MRTRKWTRERVINRIQKLHQRGTPASHIWRADRNLCAAGVALFGTWRTALEAAGLASERERWSPERVLAELRQWHSDRARRARMKPKLATAAKRYFGSLRQALVAAGLRRESPPRIQRSWTRDKVIEAIQSHHSRGVGLTAIGTCDKPLYAAAKRTFGSWRAALRATGTPQRRRITRNQIIRSIQTRHRRGQPLTHVWRTAPKLFNAAKKRFGNWQQALAAAGLPAKTVQHWSKRKVVEAIRTRQQHGPPLSRVWRDDKPLFRAATNHFGNWQSALRAAGVPFKARQRWTRERVLEELRQTYRSLHNFRHVDPSLVGAAFRFFGGLHQALDSAGLPLPAGRWSKRRIVEEIQERYIRGQPIGFVGFKDKALGYAAKRHFGTWHAAVVAAGLESRALAPIVTRTWTPDTVIAAIRAQRNLSNATAPVWKSDTGLYSAAKKHFGTWHEAVRAAGLEPLRRRWTKELVVQEIRTRHDQGLSPTSSAVLREDCRLAGAVQRYFGSWRAARAAAGIESNNHRPQTNTRILEGKATACRAKT